MNSVETHGSPNVPPRMRSLFRLRLTLLGAGLLANILLLTGVVDPIPGASVFVGALVVYLAVSLLFWRCPSCKKYPGNAVMPDFCERCGSAIFGPDASVPDLPPTHHPDHVPSLRWVLLGRGAYGLILLFYFLLQNTIEHISVLVFWVGTVILLSGGVWFEWRWWRCPHCGGYLRRTFWPGRKCVKCGGELRF